MPLEVKLLLGVFLLFLYFQICIVIMDLFKQEKISLWKAFVPGYNILLLARVLDVLWWEMCILLLPLVNLVYSVKIYGKITAAVDATKEKYLAALALFITFAIISLLFCLF